MTDPKRKRQGIWLGAPSFAHGDDPWTRLHHSGANTGNLFIGHSLAKHLDAEFAPCVTVEGAHALRERCDFVAIAAANFISPHFDMGHLADIVEAADLPCVIAGLGAQAPRQGDEIALSEGTQRFLRAVADRCELIGVRGANSAQILFDYGIRNVEVTGCPSIYLAADECKPVSGDELSALAINGSCDVVAHSLNVSRLSDVEGELYRQAMDFGADYVLQSDLLQIEIKFGGETTERLEAMKRRLPKLAHVPSDRLERFIRENCKIFFDVSAWTSYLAGRAASIGSRFHGNMAALHAGTPALFICHDARTSELCQFARLPHLSLSEVVVPRGVVYELKGANASEASSGNRR